LRAERRKRIAPEIVIVVIVIVIVIMVVALVEGE
jgi:hypothetical protein